MNPKILIVTEAYSRTTNGVWTTLLNTANVLKEMNYEVKMITPEGFYSMACPSYPEVRIVLNPWSAARMIREFAPDFIHIATEGPLALFAKLYCKFKRMNFTTSYHTKLPEYIHTRYPFIRESWVYAYLRFLHKGSKRVFVTTESMGKELYAKGFRNLVVWGRGVDREIFNSSSRIFEPASNRPWLLYVGRVSVEKNIRAFLDLKTNGHKIVVGDGPQLLELQDEYLSDKRVSFLGAKHGMELAFYYANADVFVFPSLTDTFGIVMIEASACGTPIAAFPVTGPKDYVKQGVTGYLSDDLQTAVDRCLKLSRTECENEAAKNTWENCTHVFVNHLYPVK